ncbi:hypothetical protein B296_00047621, partial [Ensete ventricosum]
PSPSALIQRPALPSPRVAALGPSPLRAGAIPVSGTSTGAAVARAAPIGGASTHKRSSYGRPACSLLPAFGLLPLRVATSCGLAVGDCPHLSQPSRPLQGALAIVDHFCRGLATVGCPCRWPGRGRPSL